jgi:Predicted membrane protein (DUF2142)
VSASVWLTLLCLLGAARVGLFAAALPPFHPVDEAFHYDLVVKYARGHVPRRITDEPLDPATREAIVLWGTGISSPRADSILLHRSPEYLSPRSPDGVPPPVWTAPAAVRAAAVLWGAREWDRLNYEAVEPPLYYVAAGAWHRLGAALGLTGGRLFYWTRFLNALLGAALVAVAAAAARLATPGAPGLAFGLALFAALVPRGTFYGVSDDALTPLAGGLAFYALLRLARAPAPSMALAIGAGLTVAVALLTKATALPMLVVLAIALIARRPWAGRAEAVGALAALASAAIPVLAWQALYWVAGAPSASMQKAAALGWTPKALTELWPHPIFGPAFVTAFLRETVATFWRGELVWHQAQIGWPSLDSVYVGSTLVCVAAAVATRPRWAHVGIWGAAAAVFCTIALLAFLSVRFDFGARTQYPSPAAPYFTAGRLLFGVLVPIGVLYVAGLARILRTERRAVAALAVLLLVLAGAEVATTREIFGSAYNWFHLP